MGRLTNQVDHIDRYKVAFEYTLMYDVSGADCDSDHYLVVAKVRERLAVCKQEAQ